MTQEVPKISEEQPKERDPRDIALELNDVNKVRLEDKYRIHQADLERLNEAVASSGGLTERMVEYAAFQADFRANGAEYLQSNMDKQVQAKMDELDSALPDEVRRTIRKTLFEKDPYYKLLPPKTEFDTEALEKDTKDIRRLIDNWDSEDDLSQLYETFVKDLLQRHPSFQSVHGDVMTDKLVDQLVREYLATDDEDARDVIWHDLDAIPEIAGFRSVVKKLAKFLADRKFMPQS